MLDVFNVEQQAIAVKRSIFDGLDGIWIRPYEPLHDENGQEKACYGINSQHVWSETPFEQKNYIFLGHANGTQWNVTIDKKEYQYDTSAEIVPYVSNEKGELKSNLAYYNNKLLSKLGGRGTLQTRYESLKQKPVATLKQSDIDSDGMFCIALSMVADSVSIDLEFESSGVLLTMTKINHKSVSDNEYYYNFLKGMLFGKIAQADLPVADVAITATGTITHYLVSYGHNSPEIAAYNIVLSYYDAYTTKRRFIEIYKAYIDESASYSFRALHDAGEPGAIPIGFTAYKDITRPQGDQLYSELNQFDLSQVSA